MQKLGLRSYSPGLARWTKRDPIAERGGENLYGFVENRPIDKQDVLGRMARPPKRPCCEAHDPKQPQKSCEQVCQEARDLDAGGKLGQWVAGEFVPTPGKVAAVICNGSTPCPCIISFERAKLPGEAVCPELESFILGHEQDHIDEGKVVCSACDIYVASYGGTKEELDDEECQHRRELMTEIKNWLSNNSLPAGDPCRDAATAIIAELIVSTANCQ